MDFCRALSAALFDGVDNTVVFSDLSATERFQALEAGDVDVLSRLTTDNLERDVLEPSTGVGFSFSQPDFYDGLTFGGIPPYVASLIVLAAFYSICHIRSDPNFGLNAPVLLCLHRYALCADR